MTEGAAIDEKAAKRAKRARMRKRAYRVITVASSIGWLLVLGLYVSTDHFKGFGGIPSADSIASAIQSHHGGTEARRVSERVKE